MPLVANTCLIIPDVHQNIAWVDRVLSKENTADKVVFLGDYFDTRKPAQPRTGVGATCLYLTKIFQELGEKAVFLLGNHDIQYLEAKPACDHYRTPRNLHYQCGSAFSHAAAAKIAKDLAGEFWQKSRLFVQVDGWLLSHAGISPGLWPQAATVAESLVVLDQRCALALQTMKRGPDPLLQAGKVRGGEAERGGITWLDWNEEFTDALPLPQIVGHTPSEDGARKKGRSWCLDGLQTCYAILTEAGVSVKTC